MSETNSPGLSGVSETLLIPLYNRAMESQRPDALMKDERAVWLVAQLGAAFERIRQIPMNQPNKVMRILLTREMDRYSRDFLSRHPDGVVVHIGCGLDSRFERVDNGRVEWFDLDLPEVIELRRKWIGGEGERYHLLGVSVLEDAWRDVVQALSARPFLFLAETVFVYFEEAQVKSLVISLRDHFPGAELVFDAFSPFDVWVGNRQLSLSASKIAAGLLKWGLRRGRELEGWGAGIRMLDQWGYFDRPEPRLAAIWWMPIARPLLGGMRIYHFQFDKSAA